MDNARLEFLFKRYLDGNTSQEESQELLRYIADNDNHQVKALLDELWNNPSETLPPRKSDEILNAIMTDQGKFTSLRRRQTAFRWLKVAAVVSLIAIASAGIYESVMSESATDKEPSLIAAIGEHREIRLPDGSTVILNASSKLEYPDTFAGDTRTVLLTGEAFFDIVPDASRPFIVHAGALTTTVLGTAFNVKAYPEENDITVTVTRGKVSVSNSSVLLGVLNPDEQITFHKTSKQSKQQSIQSAEAVSWTESDIFFDDVSLADAVARLEQRFHIKIRFQNEQLKTCRFTATFIQGEDLHQILTVICAFNGATYQTGAGGDVIIDGEGCMP